MIQPNSISIQSWPPQVTGGMQTGTYSQGVKITHVTSGVFVTCNDHRHQHKNRISAMALLEEELIKKEFELIAGWIELDLSKAKRKLMRLKRKGDKELLKSQESIMRTLRRELWDLEDILQESLNISPELLKDNIATFTVLFPITCRSAINYNCENTDSSM